ncbi:MAG: Rne/Rng family ribonuclease [Candidatus Lambdaproteobacteria bacterium]|nr:Rne/Rng family ribonuclease [Candidatus Lambdaproteobacteria bacterium]
MAREIIINHTPQETRVAVLDNAVLTELYHERDRERGVVGNIYKGKVLKVLPGMEAAFVDIGLEKASFLYVDDVLPDFTVHEDLDESGGDRPIFQASHSRKEKRPPINQLLKEGQEILVQVSKEPIGTKGARITGHLSIPGRNLVLMPTAGSVGVSRQITEDAERHRLKEIVQRLKPENAGFIIRTAAEGRREDEFRTDINFLVSTWDAILRRYGEASAPSVVYSDLSLTYRVIRDMLSEEVRRLIIDDEQEFTNVSKFLKEYLPRFRHIVEPFRRRQSIYDHYGIEEEIDRALSNKVWLKSGGYLIIDQTEALTSIDVNTGRFVGKASHEETILKTNLESVQELVYQLKLRNIGGIIIIDFIDMEVAQNRQRVYQALKEELKHDKARSKILQISEIGLVEMTRKRDRENLGRLLSTPCPYCDGMGRIKSLTTIAFELFREIDRIRLSSRRIGALTVNVHPDVADFLAGEEARHLERIEQTLGRKINVRSIESFHHEQYEIFEF